MLSFVLAAAAQVSAPVPLNLKGWVSPTDMPELPGGRGFWMVGVDLLVDTDGTLRGCTIERTSTIAALDKLTCDLIHKRARFRPAQWADGSPVTGVYRTSVGYSQGDGSDMPWLYGYDLEVRVKSLPSGMRNPTRVRVMFAVDSAGAVSSCTAEPGENFEMAENKPILVPVSCEQLMQNYKPIPVRDPSGNLIKSVQDAVVQFSTHK